MGVFAVALAVFCFDAFAKSRHDAGFLFSIEMIAEGTDTISHKEGHRRRRLFPRNNSRQHMATGEQVAGHIGKHEFVTVFAHAEISKERDVLSEIGELRGT